MLRLLDAIDDRWQFILLFIWTGNLSFLNINIFGSAILHLPRLSTHGPSFRILDWACHHRTPLCQIRNRNKDILQGSFRLCDWFSLRCLVPWINHLCAVSWFSFLDLALNDSWLLNFTSGKPPLLLFQSYLYIDLLCVHMLRYNEIFFSICLILTAQIASIFLPSTVFHYSHFP